LLHRAAGYSLLGSNREQLNFMSVGEGSNGKSVFLRTIQHVLGEYATSIPISAFDARSRTSHQESIANLPGIRFVVALEPPKHMALAGEKLKEIAGGDVQKVSRKHEHEFEFVSQASLWFGVNHPPAVADDSLGFWRKLLVIPFRRNFEDDPKKDPDLLEKLEAEAEGILQWLIQGCVEYQKQGLGLTGKLRRETEIYRREEDSIYAFLGDSTKEEANGRAKRSEMYPAYERWGTKNFISVAKLAKKSELFEVLRRKYQEVKVQGEMYFKGLRLTVEVEEDEDAEVEY